MEGRFVITNLWKKKPLLKVNKGQITTKTLRLQTGCKELKIYESSDFIDIFRRYRSTNIHPKLWQIQGTWTSLGLLLCVERGLSCVAHRPHKSGCLALSLLVVSRLPTECGNVSTSYICVSPHKGLDTHLTGHWYNKGYICIMYKDCMHKCCHKGCDIMF